MSKPLSTTAGSTTVRARIDEATKEEAQAVFASMGVTVSDAFRLMMVRIAKEKALPFNPLVPNQETIAAMKEARAGKGASGSAPSGVDGGPELGRGGRGRLSASKLQTRLQAREEGQHGRSPDAALTAVPGLLIADHPLPVRYQDHPLSGTWSDHRDCHIRPDLVLIYRTPDADTLQLVRLGSHSEAESFTPASARLAGRGGHLALLARSS